MKSKSFMDELNGNNAAQGLKEQYGTSDWVLHNGQVMPSSLANPVSIVNPHVTFTVDGSSATTYANVFDVRVGDATLKRTLD